MKKQEIKDLPLKEKIKLLSENDKWYLLGYVDRALKGKITSKITEVSKNSPTSSEN